MEKSSSQQTQLAKRELIDFSDAISLTQVMFQLYHLSECSDRVQRYLSRVGKSSLSELSCEEYTRFSHAMQRAWLEMPIEYQSKLGYVFKLLNALGLSWEHPVIHQFLSSQNLSRDGLTLEHLSILADVLQEEFEEIQQEKIRKWEQAQQQSNR